MNHSLENNTNRSAKTPLSEEKYKRIVVASTVGAVLLVVILVFIMIYQLISIGVNKKINDEYQSAIAEYERLIKEGENTLEIRKAESWIMGRAKELGYYFQTGAEDLTP